MASMTIREIDPERDAEQVVELVVKTNPIAVTNAEEWRHRIRAVPERAHSVFRVATLGDRVVGLLEAGLEFFGSGELARFGVRVDPGFRRRGIGTELHEQGLAHIRSLGRSRAVTMFVETDEAVSFATARGWREVRAEVFASLDPRTVMERPDSSTQLEPVGELDPREVHAVDEEATRDMPSFEAIEAIPFDDWRALAWDNPLFTREGSFGAIVDGRVVALSLIFADAGTARAFSIFTGTLRPYRGRGLARAVKLATVHWAAVNGITQLVTTNDETNAPMLAVNRRLGYRPAGRRVEYVLEDV
jgi:GNAT superfamily N-acetyltransferase